eukprot:gene2120-biopygen2021
MSEQRDAASNSKKAGQQEEPEVREPKSRTETLLEQQSAMMKLVMQQMTDLNARVEVAEETAAKAVSQGNPFPARPATLDTDMPQMYDLYNDKTYDALSKRTNSSMRYDKLVLAPALSYMHDAPAYSDETLDWLQDEKAPPTLEELGERVCATHNTLKGVFALLSNRYTMIQLRADMKTNATSHGGADALRAKLAFIEEKVYARSDGLVTDSVLTMWLKDFNATKAKGVMQTHVKASAKGCKVKVYWQLDDAWYTGTVDDTGSDGRTHIAYEDGDEERLDMTKELFEVVPAAVQEMQWAALGSKTVANYRPKARAFMTFCETEGREWLPATEATLSSAIHSYIDPTAVADQHIRKYFG